MDMFDEAQAIESTMRLCRLTQGALAQQLGVSQSYIANKLRLLGLSDRVREKVRSGGVTERHARALLRLDDEDEQLRLLDDVISRKMTVRECEAQVDAIADFKPPTGFSRAEGLERIELLRSSIGRGVENLVSCGVDARVRTTYADGNMYITVVIKDA